MTELSQILDRVEKLERDATEDLNQVDSLDDYQEVRVNYLGRNGAISELFNQLEELPDQGKASAGKAINSLKNQLSDQLEEIERDLKRQQAQSKFEEQSLDVTMPGRKRKLGTKHVLTQINDEIVNIFHRMGFATALGPEVETDYYNFEALNMPKFHPARDEWDSFYLDEDNLLRTHTSPVQIRVMENQQPPVKIICPGKCYRRDTPDSTHYPVFHQVELLWVDEELTLANLKYVIKTFVEGFFGPDFKWRFAADYFPFTEPSAQVHIQRPDEDQWLEIMGAGMVDPHVLDAVNYDTETHQGFALGLGVERMAMLKYGVEDIRSFYRNDVRFLNQFS